MRCFTFQDFQITPILDEFEHLIGITMKNKLPLMGMEEPPKHEIIDDALRMHKKDIPIWKLRGILKGFHSNF